MTMKKMQFIGVLVYVFGVVSILQAELDLNKINSSAVKPAINFDALEQSLARIEQQLADTTAQVQTLKAHVLEVKNTAQEQMQADAQEKEKLLLHLQETQEAHASLQHQIATSEIAVCLDQELSACLASTVIEPLAQDPVLVVAQAGDLESDSFAEIDEGSEDEYEDEL